MGLFNKFKEIFKKEDKKDIELYDKGEIGLDALTLCEDGRNPEITDTERDSKVKMWKKAVSYSFDWAKQ